MGTNYYWHDDVNTCKTCGHNPVEPLHIGKASAGWTFSFHGTESIRSWKQWKELLLRESPRGHIENEYGDILSFEELELVVESKKFSKFNMKDHAVRDDLIVWKDPEGHCFNVREFS